MCVWGRKCFLCSSCMCASGWIQLIVLSRSLASTHNPTIHLYLPQLHFSFSSFTNPVYASLFIFLHFSHSPNKQTYVWLTFLTDWPSGSGVKFSLNPPCHKQCGRAIKHSSHNPHELCCIFWYCCITPSPVIYSRGFLNADLQGKGWSQKRTLGRERVIRGDNENIWI